MKRKFLIVETPRAAEFGHRILVPAEIRDERLVAAIVEDAARNPVGRWHVAVSRPTEQRLSSGSVRSGTESLIVAGIAGERLNKDQRERVITGLKELWVEVDSILPRLAEFGLSSRAILVNCDELDLWLRGLTLSDLPNANLPTADSSVSDVWKRWLKPIVLVGLALILISGLLWFRFWGPGDTSISPKRPGVVRSGPRDVRADVRRQLDELAKRWGCKPRDVAGSICRASAWQPEPVDPVDRVLLESTSSDLFLDRLRSLSSGRPGSLVLFLRAPKRASEDLREILGARDHLAAMELRKALDSTWQAFETLRSLTERLGKPFEELDVTPSGFRKSMVFLSRIDREPGLGDDFVRPVTPIFERQDAMIIWLLESWLVDGTSQGLSEALSQANVVVPDGETLVPRLKRLHANSSRIMEALKYERKGVVDRASARRYKGKLDPTDVREAYEKTEEYMTLVCKVARD